MAAIYLLPNTLGQDNFDYIIPKDVVNIIDSLTYFIVENEKTARAYIKHLLPEKNQRELRLEILDKQTDPLDLPYFLDPIKKRTFHRGFIRSRSALCGGSRCVYR